jgi:succinyl-diaminopimelate desuccinylase
MQKTELFVELDKLKHEMEEALITLISSPAIAPENGGDGEEQKAERLFQILRDVGFDKIDRFDAEDGRVSSGKRPNIVAYVNGESDRRLWIVTHLDVVPSGEESAWTVTKPFKPVLSGERIYGRGSEDNGQSLVASVYAVKALRRLGIKPKRTVALAFVADEEQGSTFGIQHLINKGLFRQDDLVLVPDAGNEAGSFIEVAEKSILWFKLRTLGKQTHGSLPNKGLNAHRIGMQVSLALDEMLHEKYFFRDYKFDVPESTFEPTKKERNVEAVNVVPGEDIVYFDCRIHPNYDLDEVLGDIKGVLGDFEVKTGAKFNLEILQKQVSAELEVGNSEIVSLLKEAIKEARGLDATVGGIGGGSCAAFFRKIGIGAVVWSTVDEVAHQPNEYSKVANMVGDAKVFALLAMK